MEIAPPNTFIKATTKTYLKKQPINSSKLLDDQKVLVPVGTKYKVLKHSSVRKHLRVNQEAQPQSSQIPPLAIDMIKMGEGFRQKAYPDAIHGWKVATIGYGTTTYPDGRKVQRGNTITQTEAEKCLGDFVDKKCRPALEKIPTWKQMNDNQRSALYSFAYNLGVGFYRGRNFDSITKVCDSPERWSDKAWVKTQFVKYCNPGTPAEKGLRRRREEEAELFCTPTSTTTVNKENKMPNYSGETNGHCIVELEYGQGIWYIWQNHWDLPWYQHSDDKELFGNLKLGNDLASRIIKYMKTKSYKVFTNPQEYNIRNED